MILQSCSAEYLKNLLTSDGLLSREPVASSPQLLLVDEAEARRLLGGVCGKTMYNLRKQGLPSVKLGTRVMYAPQDLAQWVEQSRTAAN